MPPKLTAAEIEARDAARLNELGYKQVHTTSNRPDVTDPTKERFFLYKPLGIKKRIISESLNKRSRI